VTRSLEDVKAAIVGAEEAAHSPQVQAAPQQKTGPPHSQLLLRMVKDAGDEFFHTPAGVAYARIQRDGHIEVLPIRRRGGYRGLLIRRYHAKRRRVPSAQALDDVLTLLSARALYDGPEVEVYVRVAPHPTEDGIVLDLGDDAWRQVVVTRDGWGITTEPLVPFRRPATLRPLPAPQTGGSINLLRPLVNVTDDAWPLIVAFMLGMLHPTGPYPLLLLIAQHGAGKSLLASIVKALVDPASAPLRAAPRDEGDLLIAAQNAWALAFDNLSTLPASLSDSLARLATGGGLSKRQLYTDEDEVVLEAKRPMIITGIEDIATRGDLLDRALLVELAPIEPRDRRPERELLNEYERVRPLVLGALLDAAVIGLQRRPTLEPVELPRLADFGLWALACEPATGLPAGSIASALAEVARRGAHTALEADILAGAVQKFMESRDRFDGRATELLAELEAVTPEAVRRSKAWPKAATALAGRLRHLVPSLRAAGIAVTSSRSRGITTWSIEARIEPPPEGPLPPLPRGHEAGAGHDSSGSGGGSGGGSGRHAGVAVLPRGSGVVAVLETKTATQEAPSQTRESTEGSGGSGPAPHRSISMQPSPNGDLGLAAAEVATELRPLGLEVWQDRHRLAAPHATAAPTWWESTAITEPLVVAIAVELLARDQLAGAFAGRAHVYLAAARAAVAAQRDAPGGP
jgi:hypothetical protein